MTADEMNRVYTIRDLWHKLGVAGEPPRPGAKVCSPLREDKHPSFSIFDGGFKARDFSLGISYSAIDFFGAVRGIAPEHQVAEYSAWLSQNGVTTKPAFVAGPSITDLAGFKPPTETDCRRIAAVRGIDAIAIGAAGNWGTVKIGDVFGYDSWILTDEKKSVAEARRIDNQKYPAVGNLAERKAHTFKGSKKNWPVGLWLPSLEKLSKVLLVEGGPDYLAGIDLIINYGSADVIVCAMLGTEANISAIALVRLASKTVRIMAHNDSAGLGAANRWWNHIHNAGGRDTAIVKLEETYGDLNDFMAKATDEEKQETATDLYTPKN